MNKSINNKWSNLKDRIMTLANEPSITVDQASRLVEVTLDAADDWKKTADDYRRLFLTSNTCLLLMGVFDIIMKFCH